MTSCLGNTVACGVLLLTGILLMPGPALAEALTEEQGEAIVEELRGIRELLEQIQKQGVERPAPANAAQTTLAKASTYQRPVLGRNDAPVTLVEFTDYQCPYCSRFVTTTLPTIKSEYIDTGKVRFVVKDLPLAMHPLARKAAIAAHCAGEQDQFWAMHDVLFANNRQLQEQYLTTYAETIGLEMAPFQECLDSGRHRAQVEADEAEASAQGITGTPTFIIGRTTGDAIEGVKLRGAQPVALFREQIDALLKTLKDPES